MIKPFLLAPFVRSYFQDHLTCQRNVSRNTILSYRDGIKLFLQDVALRLKKPVVDLLVTDVCESLVLEYLTNLEQQRGNTIQTRNQRLVGIRRLFDYIAWREPLVLDHCRLLLAIPRKRGQVRPEIGYLEKHEMAAVLKVSENSGGAARRDYPLLLFMYNTGARVQEVADAQRSWLSLQPATRRAASTAQKGRKLPDIVRSPENASGSSYSFTSSMTLDPDQNQHLFVNHAGYALSRSGIADIIRRYVRKAAEFIPLASRIDELRHISIPAYNGDAPPSVGSGN